MEYRMFQLRIMCMLGNFEMENLDKIQQIKRVVTKLSIVAKANNYQLIKYFS